MEIIRSFWRKITNTDALKHTSGIMETYFFETVYRLTYIEGISAGESSILYFVYSNTVRLLLIILCISELCYFIANIHSIDAATDSVNILMIQSGALYKYINWRRNLATFKYLSSSMESPHFDLSTKGRKIILDMWINRNMDTLKLLIGLGIGTLIAWYVYPLVDDHDYNLPVALVMPFNYATPARYFFTYLSVVIVFSYISFFVMINDLIMQAYLMHLLCQFDVLNDCFRNILVESSAQFGDAIPNTLYQNINFQKVFIRRLGNLVEQHKFVLNSTMKLRDILGAPMLMQMGVSTTLLCSIGYQAVTNLRTNITKSIMGLLYLGYNMFVLYTICRWCEEVKTQSESTRDAIYSSGWENGVAMVPGVRSRILLILLRGNKPLVMSAGGMYELSLAAFSTMVKTSYSALTVLLRLQRNN